LQPRCGDDRMDSAVFLAKHSDYARETNKGGGDLRKGQKDVGVLNRLLATY
jgi:hypothetical protein